MSVASVSQPGLTPYFWGRVSVGGVSQPAPDTQGCRHTGRGRIPRPKGNTFQRPELHWRRAARLRTSNRLGRSDACAGAWPRTPRLRSTLCACAGLAEAPAEYVRWCRRAETSWVARRARTYPRTYPRTPRGSAEFRAFRVGPEQGEGKRSPCRGGRRGVRKVLRWPQRDVSTAPTLGQTPPGAGRGSPWPFGAAPSGDA